MKTAIKVATIGKAEGIPPRERILAVAADLFYRHGIRAVGVEAIAEAAGTNKMTLYRHFASKDELVAAYLRCLAEKASASGRSRSAPSRRCSPRSRARSRRRKQNWKPRTERARLNGGSKRKPAATPAFCFWRQSAGDIYRCRPPRKRGTQYAAAIVRSARSIAVSGILDRPPEPVIGRACARPVGGR